MKTVPLGEFLVTTLTALADARELARLMYGILSQFPSDPGELDPRLDILAVPGWLVNRDTDA